MFILFYTPSSMLGALLGILLSLTPMAQIFRLSSFFFRPSTMMLDMLNMSSIDQKNVTDDFTHIVMKLLTNETLEIQDLVMSLMTGREFEWAHRDHIGGGSSLQFRRTSSSIPWIHHTTWDDLSEVIPWIISLIIFVVVPVVMKIAEALRRHRGFGQHIREQKQRIINTNVIEKCLRMCRKVVCKDDLISEETDEVVQESAILSVPLPGTLFENLDDLRRDGSRSFTGSCAICLSSFFSGDMIVWSSNAECQDVFHEACFKSWAQRKGYPICPCCRQSFVKEEILDRVLRSSVKDQSYFKKRSN